MDMESYDYIIVGAGLAGAAAVEGIREINTEKTILLIGKEKYLPYHRPNLTKQLWFGKKKVEDIFVHDMDYYRTNKVNLKLGTEVTEIDPENNRIRTANGETYRYEKLLLATGGTPKKLKIPGGETEGIYYYRYLNHYEKLRSEAVNGKTAAIIGGGFIGSEIAAALTINNVKVITLFPERYFQQAVLPEGPGMLVLNKYLKRGVTVHSEDTPAAIDRHNGKYIITTSSGDRIVSDILIAGIGIEPEVGLLKGSGIKTSNGILVNEYLETSVEGIYAAGDNANFPYRALEKQMRVEHWDNAKNAGKRAGRNMAGAKEAYTYMPYFFSDLFDFGYEAVGDIDSKMKTNECWEKENVKGIILYTKDNRVRGMTSCNTYGVLDQGREWIKDGLQVLEPELCSAIK